MSARSLMLVIGLSMVAGCHRNRPMPAPAPVSAAVFANPPKLDVRGSLIRDSVQRTAVLETLAAQQRRWEHKRPTSYEYAIVYRCFCFGGTFGAYRRYLVQITRGNVSVFDSTGTPIRTDQRQAEQLTIDAMFSALRDQIVRGADYAQIIYDPDFGFPGFADADRIMVTDTGFGFTIRGFKARD